MESKRVEKNMLAKANNMQLTQEFGCCMLTLRMESKILFKKERDEP